MNLLEQVRQAGIIGAGGAGFPTHVKLDAQAEFILMNAAECEPLLRVDQQLMDVYADDIIRGFEKAGHQVQAKQAIIGIKEKHQGVIHKLRERIAELGVGDFVSVKELPDVYPAGDEQVLVYELTGRVVPEAGIPLNVGCVVVNSETALNIENASKGQGVVDTYVTLAGDIPQRMTLKVPVGTKLMDVLKLTGIEDFSDYAVIDGGPMMGPVMGNLNGHIVKKSKGYVILKKDHPHIVRKRTTLKQATRVNRAACEQCRMCTDLCPRYLIGHNMQPHRMMSALTYQVNDIESQKIALLCCQCGLCEMFSCPAGLFPKNANVFFKNKLGEQKIRFDQQKEHYQAHPMREYRMVPSKRLIARLGLYPYDAPAPLMELPFEPEEVHIKMRQHIGAPAVPVVSVGDVVTRGQCIGEIPENALGARVHASISGKVTEVGTNEIVIRRV